MSGVMSKSQQVADALNQLGDTNLRGAVHNDVWFALIEDYYAHPDGDNSDSSSDDEDDLDDGLPETTSENVSKSRKNTTGRLKY